VEPLRVDAVGIVAVAACRDCFAFPKRPAHPSEPSGGEHLGVELRDFGTIQIVQGARDGFVGKDGFAESPTQFLIASNQVLEFRTGVCIGVSAEDIAKRGEEFDVGSTTEGGGADGDWLLRAGLSCGESDFGEPVEFAFGPIFIEVGGLRFVTEVLHQNAGIICQGFDKRLNVVEFRAPVAVEVVHILPAIVPSDIVPAIE